MLDKNSHLAGRVVEYGGIVDKYTIIVPARKDEEIILSGKVRAYGRGGCNKIIKFFRVFSLAKKLLRGEKYDLITVQDQYFLGWLALKLARRFKIGLEIQVHGFEKFFGLRKIIAKFVIPKADAVRAVSQKLKKKLINDFGVKEEKITVAPIYVERTTHNVERTTHNSQFIFLTVGRLVPVKNISLQIKAMKEINAELWIVGDGPLTSDFGRRISDLKLNNKIKLLGWQSDLEKFYSQADAFLLTSNYEGWGMAVIEAARSGLPIIMTDVGCAEEVIKNGESGIVIPVDNQRELEKAMIKLIDNPELRKKLGEGAREAVKKLPSKEETLKLYLESWKKAALLNV